MATQPFAGLSAIGQINIPVHDLDTAVAFYRDALGMKYLFQVPNMAFFDCDGIRLLLAVPENDAFDHPSSLIYFKVGDIQAATAALRDRGVDITAGPQLVARMPDHELWMTFFRDSEANTLALMAEVPLKD
jgi:methylmalonyl-CoA/ethylmalonyl-CoA epimerase